MSSRWVTAPMVGLAVTLIAACQPYVDRGVRLNVDPVSVSPFETPPTLADAAWDHLVEKRYGSAIQLFHRQRAVEPDSLEPIYGLALGYNAIGQSDISDQYFAVAQQLDPRRARLLTNLSYRDRQNRRYDLAYARALEAYKLEPGNPATRENYERTKLLKSYADL